MKKTTLLILLISFLASCSFNANITRDNREEDKKEAEKITSQFYVYLKNKEYEQVYDFFSPLFYEVTSKSQLDSLFASSVETLGDIKNSELIHWETKVKSGTDASSEYYFVYKISREKFESTEKIGLKKDKNNKIKILGYRIESEGYNK